MSDSIHSRIVRVAQIAQRNARSSEEQTIAAELLDELKVAEVVAAGPVNRDTTEGERRAFAEGRDAALANAAMKAHDMGHPDVRLAINALIPDGSPAIPLDDPRSAPAHGKTPAKPKAKKAE